jgi:hypothetical protein
MDRCPKLTVEGEKQTEKTICISLIILNIKGKKMDMYIFVWSLAHRKWWLKASSDDCHVKTFWSLCKATFQSYDGEVRFEIALESRGGVLSVGPFCHPSGVFRGLSWQGLGWTWDSSG